MNKHLLNRRQFGVGCTALGLSLAVPGTARVLAATAASTESPARIVKFPDGTTASALGQGSWHLGQGRHSQAVEEEAVRTGVSLGMTLIDTSGNYGSGRSEEFIGQALAPYVTGSSWYQR
jgi:hypothetical protein